MITQSLLKDGDLKIENNHRRGDPAAYFTGALRPDFIQRGRDGEIYSIHAPGVSVLVLPAFALAGYRGAQAMMLLIAAAGGALIWIAAWHAARSTNAAWFAWAAVAGSATFLLQSAMVFPDAPGAAAAAAATWLLVRLNRDPSSVRIPALTLTGGALAMLPWLHTRFAVVAGGFGIAVVWLLLAETARRRAARARRALAFLALPTISAAAWFAYFRIIYGTFNPSAPYGPRPEASWVNIPGGFAGLLFDAQFGLLLHAPVLVFGLTEIARARGAGAGRLARPTSRAPARDGGSRARPPRAGARRERRGAMRDPGPRRRRRSAS